MNINLSIYSQEGVRMLTFQDGFLSAGKYEELIKRGALIPGIYIYRFETETGAVSGRFQIAK